jgi:hypothetical protein
MAELGYTLEAQDVLEHMGDYYAAFVRDEARAIGFTLEDLRAWVPAIVSKKRTRKPRPV